MPNVQQAYRAYVDSLRPADKVRRVEQMLYWTRELLARQVRQELGDIGDEQIRWEVARRMYGSDPRFLKLLQQKARDVSH